MLKAIDPSLKITPGFTLDQGFWWSMAPLWSVMALQLAPDHVYNTINKKTLSPILIIACE